MLHATRDDTQQWLEDMTHVAQQAALAVDSAAFNCCVKAVKYTAHPRLPLVGQWWDAVWKPLLHKACARNHQETVWAVTAWTPVAPPGALHEELVLATYIAAGQYSTRAIAELFRIEGVGWPSFRAPAGSTVMQRCVSAWNQSRESGAFKGCAAVKEAFSAAGWVPGEVACAPPWSPWSPCGRTVEDDLIGAARMAVSMGCVQSTQEVLLRMHALGSLPNLQGSWYVHLLYDALLQGDAVLLRTLLRHSHVCGYAAARVCVEAIQGCSITTSGACCAVVALHVADAPCTLRSSHCVGLAVTTVRTGTLGQLHTVVQAAPGVAPAPIQVHLALVAALCRTDGCVMVKAMLRGDFWGVRPRVYDLCEALDALHATARPTCPPDCTAVWEYIQEEGWQQHCEVLKKLVRVGCTRTMRAMCVAHGCTAGVQQALLTAALSPTGSAVACLLHTASAPGSSVPLALDATSVLARAFQSAPHTALENCAAVLWRVSMLSSVPQWAAPDLSFVLSHCAHSHAVTVLVPDAPREGLPDTVLDSPTSPQWQRFVAAVRANRAWVRRVLELRLPSALVLHTLGYVG